MNADLPILEARGVSVVYGSKTVLSDVSLAVPARRITAIVGPSGCGKTTLLCCFNRLVDLISGCRVSGQVLLGGTNILADSQDVLTLRRRVGMVFQKPNPFALSIRRNLALPLREHGVPAGEIEGRAEAALRDVGLWNEVCDRLDSSALSLSGGQQQRLCMARALSLKPEVILLDEPCSALDPIASGVVEDLIVALREKYSVVIVTHNLAQARRIADQVAVLWLEGSAGRLIEVGPAAQVFAAPANPTAAAYLNGARVIGA